MKQVVFKKGMALVAEVEPPGLQAGHILVAVQASCISPGTEMDGIASTGNSLIQKARKHPDKLKAAIGRMKQEGIHSVIKQALDNQGKELPSGYSASGIVLAVADDVHGFRKGERVAIAGAGYANHAEYAVVPVNLAMPIPEGVGFKEASTCALGGIALQGVRRAQTALGEINVVIGCGAIGLLTVQLLKASGCIVIAVDIDDRRLELAGRLGADLCCDAREAQYTQKILHFSDGYGVDNVIITASSQSNELLSQAFGICRKKGTVILVGVVGSEINRSDMYAKELDYLISTSYGPGRYDAQYENHGHDYPYAYVRWTENRNMRAYLGCIAAGTVRLDEIIERSFPIGAAEEAYRVLKEEKPLLVTLSYADESQPPEAFASRPPAPKKGTWINPFEQGQRIRLGIVGAGSFVQSMHFPNIKRLEEQYQVTAVCNRSGLSSRQSAQYFDGCDAYTDVDAFLRADVDMLLIGTRHNTHADLAIRGLAAGKAVFVEKPMCITRDEFTQLSTAIENSDAPFMVGYNRRFSPFAVKIQQWVKNRVNPLIIQYTMNAGYIPYDHWVHTSEGGGRIVGEACHIFDLFRSIVGSPVVSVSVDAIAPTTASVRPDDNVVVTVTYADGSVATLVYTAIGSKSAIKESMKVFCDEGLYELNDYKALNTYGRHRDMKLKRIEKGHLEELAAFADCIASGDRFPIALSELNETWQLSRLVADHLRTESN